MTEKVRREGVQKTGQRREDDTEIRVHREDEHGGGS